MVLELEFPTSLQCGDNVEIKGQAGDESFVLDLLADYWAFDPVESDKLTSPEDDLPIVRTQPLHISLEISGAWDVNADSPEASTCSHGTTARRFGFRTGEVFTCTIAIRTEYFQVSLNDMSLTSSEHLVPISSIHGLSITGDSLVSDVRYGHPSAINTHSLLHRENNGKTNVIECRLTLPDLTPTPLSSPGGNSEAICETQRSQSEGEIFMYFEGKEDSDDGHDSNSLRMQRANSYQLVFAQEDSDMYAESLETGGQSQLQRLIDSSFPAVQSESQQDLLLLDDSEFSLDGLDQMEWRTLQLHHARPVQQRKPVKPMTALSRRAHLKRKKMGFNPTGKYDKAKVKGLPIVETPREVIKVSPPVSHENLHSSLDIESLHDEQAIIPENETSTTRHLSIEVMSSLASTENISLSRRHSVHAIGRKKSVVPTTEQQIIIDSMERLSMDKPALYRSRTIATSRPHLQKQYQDMVVRNPLTELDQLWDERLAELKMYYLKQPLFEKSQIRRQTRDHTKGMVVVVTPEDSGVQSNKSAPESPTGTTSDHPSLQKPRVHITFDNDSAETKPIGGEHPIHDSSDEEKQHTRHSLYENVVTEASNDDISNYANAQISGENADSKFHATKISQPMLVVDFRPLKHHPFIPQDEVVVPALNKEEKTIQPVTLWPARPAMPTLEHSIQDNSKVKESVDLTVITEFENEATDTTLPEIRNKVSPSLLPVMRERTNGTALPVIELEHREDASIIRNSSMKRTLFRSRLPRPRSEIVETLRTSVNISDTTHRLSHQPSLRSNEKNGNLNQKTTVEKSNNVDNLEVGKKEVRSIKRIAPQIPNGSVSDTVHSKHVQNGKTSNNNSIETVKPKGAESATNGTSHRNKSLVVVDQRKIKGTSVSRSTSNLKEFVQSPRQWIAKRLPSVRKSKPAAAKTINANNQSAG